MDVTAVHTAKLSSQDFSVYLFISVHNEREPKVWNSSIWSLITESLSTCGLLLCNSCPALFHLHDYSNNDKTRGNYTKERRQQIIWSKSFPFVSGVFRDFQLLYKNECCCTQQGHVHLNWRGTCKLFAFSLKFCHLLDISLHLRHLKIEFFSVGHERSTIKISKLLFSIPENAIKLSCIFAIKKQTNK